MTQHAQYHDASNAWHVYKIVPEALVAICRPCIFRKYITTTYNDWYSAADFMATFGLYFADMPIR
ncbi:hypothetical protein NEOLEDRAFT_1139180 [Neolentinus lepideus HHB14362 ss-1]|uniref:Uncharacterized protein n=1 Tax=Neolentinus lepideus HHB14362 ss-1 TaxID=1314782 RepID=A0A165PVZ9_9AGAM|nr:hypothetical protein NEOLEDRAFT_1139180 [Neolentinus lepideus HHB14362 ss-1]